MSRRKRPAYIRGVASANEAPARPPAALLAIWALAALATALAIAVVVEPGPLPGDLTVVRWWQDLGEPVPTIAEWVRHTTSTEANLIVAVVPAWFLVTRCGRAGAAAVAIAVFTMLVAQPLLKLLIDRPRPSEAQVDVRAEHTSMSFPSGHSMSTIAVWGIAVIVLAHLGRSFAAAIACLPIVLTSQASLVQGVHWPSDSLAGLALGGISAIVAAMLVGKAGLTAGHRYRTGEGGIDGLRHAGNRRPTQGGDS